MDDFGSGLINVVEGDDIILDVIVKGELFLDIEWYKEDKFLRKISCVDFKVYGDKFFLVVLNVILGDFGLYKCLVKSKCGIVIKIFEVNIEGMLLNVMVMLFYCVKE